MMSVIPHQQSILPLQTVPFAIQGKCSLTPTSSLSFSGAHVQSHYRKRCCYVGTETGFRKRAFQIACMAHPRRVQMVAKQIRREIANMLQKDKVLQHAILPETALGADTFLSTLITISDVEVSKDLQYVKVYVSVCGDERGREIAMKGLKARQKYIRAQLGKRIRLRMTPHIYFLEDESIAKGSRVLSILESIKQEQEGKKNGGFSEIDDTEDGIYETERKYDREEEIEGTQNMDGEDLMNDEADLIYIK